MAHPMLASVARQSLLAATTAALMAGPLAVAGIAQSLTPVIDGTSTEVIELTCKEAKATEDKDLIAEFCPKKDGNKAGAPASDAEKAIADGTATVTKTVESVVRSAPDSGTDTPDGDGDGDGGGGSGPLDPIDDDTEVGGADGEYTPVPEPKDSSSPSGTTDGREALARDRGAPAGSNYDVNGPYRPGMHSYSELTLQPFAAPLVTGPMYELPRIAEQLFGTTTSTGAEAPLAADATAASASSTAATPDAAGWLAATATGLLMLVGAGHAIAGGRTPRRRRA